MLNNYFKIAIRYLWKHKGFSAINIVGLAVGLATCLLIMLYVVDELSYDKYNLNADRIYRINSDIKFGGANLNLAVTSDPMGATLKKDYPQVEEYTRIYASSGSKLIKKGNEYIEEKDVANVDSTFFNVFSLPAITGNTKTALNEPNTVVVTESAARKYFGSAEVMGKILEADKTPYKITAVIEDMPHNSHFNFSFLFSMKNVNYPWGTFLSHNFHTYILLKKGTDPKAFEKNFTQVINRYILPQAKQIMQISSMDEFTKVGNKLEYSLTPLLNIHLKSDRFPELSTNGNIQYVYIFSAVALFVLLIACINFMNLSTARSGNRAKEVGIRKVLGTRRKTLITQFLVESILTVIISILIALVMAYLVLPVFNDIASKSLSVGDLFNARVLPFVIGLPLVVGVLAGSYPAFYLSKFQPVKVLKGSVAGGFKKSALRSSLVVFQFATSIILIISTIIIYSQLHYIQTKKLGYNKDQVLIINGTFALGNNAEAFRNEVLNMPGVVSGTYSSYLPVSSSSRSDNSFFKEAVMDPTNGIDIQRWTIDYDYLRTMGMEIIKGRYFSREFGSDSNAVVINEKTASLLGYDNPIGHALYGMSSDNNPKSVPYTIIGVVKDFHFESLKQNIGPLCMMLGKSYGLASFKINTANIKGLVNQIEAKWKAMTTGMPYSYRFLDESFNNMYNSEKRVGKLAIAFAVLAIFVACLGLFGLVTFAAEQRTKEIGIRKVLGATAGSIVGLLSMDLLKLVILSAAFAFPLAWWAMHNWLQDFAYRVTLAWWIFPIAAILAIAIAIATIGIQALKAALNNPVQALRSE